MSKGQKIELCYWVVAFIDLLGQGDKMREVSRLIDSENDDEAVEKMEEIYHDHEGFNRIFHEALISNQESIPEPSLPLPPNVSKEEYQAVFKRNLKMQVFSDSIMFYLPLVENGDNQPLYGINTLLFALGIQMLSFLSGERPFRCGVEVGFGLEMEEGKLIGPPVQNAYELESKRAQYPRIVVGDRLVEYLKNIEQVGLQNGTDVQNQMAKALARISNSWLGTDIDGETILHYLSPDFLNKLPKDKTKEIIQLAYQFADREQSRYREQKNSKLAIRYACLETYFATHMGALEG